MGLVKVWNDNVHPYKEPYRDNVISIEAKGFVEMEYDDAVQFLGQFGRGIAPNAPNGRPDERFFKKLRIEGSAPQMRDSSLICHANGKRASSPEELAAWEAEHAHQRVKDEEAENAQNAQIKQLSDVVAKQQQQIEQLLAKLTPAAETKPDDNRKNRT